MKEADAEIIVLRHYRTIWLGEPWEDIAEAWQTEYDAVSSGAFNPLIVLSGGMEGMSGSAQKHFEGAVRVSALQKFRASKDSEYAVEVFAPSPNVAEAPTVMMPVFGGGCFPH